MHRTAVLMFLLATATSACGGDDDDGGDDGGIQPDLSVESAGPHGVGVRRTEIVQNSEPTRVLPFYVWYPTATPSGTFPIENLLPTAQATTYAGLLADANPACPTRLAAATLDAAPAAGPFPLVIFSHCHECTGFSALTIAERLASHGFVVMAPEHTGNTLWNQVAGNGLPLSEDTLEVRRDDVAITMNATTSPNALPEWNDIMAVIDTAPGHIGLLGHSFGAVTVGKYAQEDHPEVGAAFALAAPMENPLLPGVDIAAIDLPLGFLVAVEDNSITELGNNLIRSNFAEATRATWKQEVADAGHWSVSDLVGATVAFAAGCGPGERQTDGQPFTYLDAATGRGIAASYVTAFFRHTLRGDAGAGAYLAAARPAGTVTVETRTP